MSESRDEKSIATLRREQLSSLISWANEENPPPIDELGITRRKWLEMLGASVALSGLTGCSRQPNEKIMPYAVRPPEQIPGVARHFATSVELDGYAMGLLVETHDGRPTKIEGNPDHPASLGATSALEQALILSLYDPDRARAVRKNESSQSFDGAARAVSLFPGERGDGFRILMPPTSSPLIFGILQRIVSEFPNAKICFYSPLATTNAREGTRLLFGRPLQTQVDLRQARVVLSVDADLFGTDPNRVRAAKQFAERRSQAISNSRLYCIESAPSITGSFADHRVAARSSEIGQLLAQVVGALVRGNILDVPVEAKPLFENLGSEDSRLKGIVRDLAEARGAVAVYVGDRQPKEVHAMGALLNHALGGSTVWYSPPTLIGEGLPTLEFEELQKEMSEGAVQSLLILSGNPSYASPGSARFSELLRSVPNSGYLGPYENETARDAKWFIPEAHPLESWGDCRAYDGTLSIVQPLIAPLFPNRQKEWVLAVLAKLDRLDVHSLLKDSWLKQRQGEENFELYWEQSLRAGVLLGTELPHVEVEISDGSIALLAQSLVGPPTGTAIELNFYPDPHVLDGRFSNNAWLMELPRPITKLTWDNALLMSANLARSLAIENGDVARVEVSGKVFEAPVLVVPGHAESSISIHWGFGREGAENVARGAGVNAFRTMPSPAPFTSGVRVARAGRRYPLAQSQKEFSQKGRPIALRYRDGQLMPKPEEPKLSETLHQSERRAEPQWAMTIDMSQCTSCNACVVACQAENNIPVVGKEGVLRGREMQWLRIDTYWEEDEQEFIHQPMTCQHCEMAPCEYVCPVNATTHSPDGLNEMIYNRCVGTRFCSNNCPYKVRRFNYFDWYEHVRANQGLVKLQRNPDVTVRDRGVMEKCTYCVQRIREAGIRASIDRRPIRPKEVQSACAQACPTAAISFGTLTDEHQKHLRESPRLFRVLEELGTSPRTAYLAQEKNHGAKPGGRHGD